MWARRDGVGGNRNRRDEIACNGAMRGKGIWGVEKGVPFPHIWHS